MANVFRPPCDEGVIRPAPEVAPCTKNVGRWVLAATIMGSSMAFIDATVVNVALPTLQAELGATVVDVQWVIESYALFLAALILVGGSLGDRFGRRRIYALGVGFFAIASVWCGLAQSAGELIVARAAQGVGAALLVPGSLAIISASFSKDQRGKAIGTWSGFTAMTAALGPVLGGWLIDSVSWRAIFYINVPLAALVLGILFSRVPESRDESAAGLDWLGALLTTVGLGALIYGLIESARLGFRHPAVLGALAVGVAGLVSFVILEARSSAPMLRLSLFRSRTFSGANVLTVLLYAALAGMLFFLPFNLIQVQGYTATAAGAALLPLILLLFLLSRWSGGLVDRYGAKTPLIIGPIIVAFGFLLIAVPGIGGSYWTTFFPGIVVLGLGMAISVAPLTTAVMTAVEVRYSGIASGINNAASRVAGLLSIAVLGILALGAFNGALDNRLSMIDLPPEALLAFDGERIKLAAAEVPAMLSGTQRAAVESAIAESFVKSFRLIVLLATGLALAGAVSAALMIGGESRGPGAGVQDNARARV